MSCSSTLRSFVAAGRYTPAWVAGRELPTESRDTLAFILPCSLSERSLAHRLCYCAANSMDFRESYCFLNLSTFGCFTAARVTWCLTPYLDYCRASTFLVCPTGFLRYTVFTTIVRLPQFFKLLLHVNVTNILIN